MATLNKGTFSKAIVIEDKTENTKSAKKILSFDKSLSSEEKKASDVATSAKIIDTIQQLRHPNIVPYINMSVNESEGQLELTMQYYKGVYLPVSGWI